jgi:hypothetical protein
MSSNRLIYDNCAYATELKESVSPLEYNLFMGKYETCDQCPVGDYPNILKFNERTLVENELYGLLRPNTKCPSNKYKANAKFDNPKLSVTRLCENIHYITPNNLEKPKTNMINLHDQLCEKSPYPNTRISNTYLKPLTTPQPESHPSRPESKFTEEKFANISGEVDDESMYSSCYSMINKLNLGVNTCSKKNANETRNITNNNCNEKFMNTEHMEMEEERHMGMGEERHMGMGEERHMGMGEERHMGMGEEGHMGMKSEPTVARPECPWDSVSNWRGKCVKCGLPLIASHKLNKCICGSDYTIVDGDCVLKKRLTI